MYSKGKIGKSLLGAQMLHSLATGEPFFGVSPAQPMPCVMVQGDTPRAVWQDELKQAEFSPTSPVIVLSVDPGFLSQPMRVIEPVIAPYRPCYFMWDALDSLFTGIDINLPQYATECLWRLQTLSQGPYCLIHHDRKGSQGDGQDDMRDAAAASRVIVNRADQLIHLRSPVGPIEVTGRLSSHTYQSRNIRRSQGGMWVYTAPSPLTSPVPRQSAE